MTRHVAVIDEARAVLRVLQVDDDGAPAGEHPERCVTLSTWAGWPTPPHAAATLRVAPGATVVSWSDSRSLAEVAADRWAAIKARRQQLDDAPIEVGGITVDADAGSRTDVMGAIMAMQLTGQASRLWRCADNVMRELTLAQLVEVGVAIAARRQALIETSDALWQQLLAAQTVGEVEAIGWPA